MFSLIILIPVNVRVVLENPQCNNQKPKCLFSLFWWGSRYILGFSNVVSGNTNEHVSMIPLWLCWVSKYPNEGDVARRCINGFSTMGYLLTNAKAKLDFDSWMCIRFVISGSCMILHATKYLTVAFARMEFSMSSVVLLAWQHLPQREWLKTLQWKERTK